MKVRITPEIQVSNFGEPYIIAELGSNHNGDMELARRLIKAAKEAGADCVKFQSWSKETIFAREKYEKNFFLADDYRDRNDFTLEEIVEKFSISEQELVEMKQYADELGIACTSTPFSKRETDFLVDVLETPFIKVASMDLNNYPFLDYLARKGKPIVLSTGLSTLAEIDKAIQTIEAAGNREIVILHCVSIYPPDDDQVHLNNIETLQGTYPYPVGFSDHTLGTSIPLASVAKGACLLEKHFTLDKTLFGWDHKVSADPEELAVIVRESKRIHKAMGSHRIASPEDATRKSEFRRSIVLTGALPAGHVLKEEDIDYKRPGTGIPPEYRDFIVGRTLKRDLPFDHILQKDDLV